MALSPPGEAANGGAIPFHRPFNGEAEEAAALRVLRSGWLTTGKEALAFEEEFAAFLEEPRNAAGPAEKERPPPRNPPAALRCLAVNSATSGLHLALEALGVGPGDAVFLPAYTFTATAEVVRYLGAEAVFVDLAPDSFNIDGPALEGAITGLAKRAGGGPEWRPRAVIPVHFGGLPLDMGAILAAARRHGLGVVEDAAHAFPARIGGPDGPWAGTAGDAGVFSFYATKTITTGEGGMVVTRREDLARRIAVMRNHGVDRPVWNRYTDANASWYYDVIAPGYKYNMPDLLAAVGRVQLGRALELLAARVSIAERYDRAFAGQAALILPPPGGARHLYPLRLREPERRDGLIENLRAAGIGASVHFIPLHLMTYYKNRYGLRAEDFPESLKRFRETLSLPLWPGMSGSQVDRVIESVLAASR
ncbi:MAG: DegT/DnrJ/EryC1/StrS family aminotransferase [Treponema sp.]|jgi:dTDP-4-amino-4,6-dideoxygalactose transaminase|nr:DegT/DnrJ/EryC1/StrS family aminotransferase [Treponema sp.]